MTPTCDVSVVIPAYNARSFIIAALASITTQTVWPKEVLVINDGSTDDTYDVIAQWLAATPQPYPVTLLTQANRGLPATRNVGMRAATGAWIALLDADDIWEPCHLEELVGAIALRPEAVAAYGNGCLLVGEVLSDTPYDNYWDNPSKQYGKPIAGSACLAIDAAIFPRLIKGNFIKPSSLMFSSAVSGRLGLFDESLRTGEDREFLARLILNGDFVYTPRPVTQYRWHDDNISQGKNAKRNQENGLRVLDKIIKGTTFTLTGAQRAACDAAIRTAAAEYLYICAKAGFSTYLGGLGVVRGLFGARRMLAASSVKHVIHGLTPATRT